MRIKMIAILGVAAFLGVAPQAFAMNGGGGNGGSTPISGSGGGYTGTGSCTGNTCSGTVTGPNGQGGTFTGELNPSAQAVEPLTALAVGLGLLGARYLRRR